LALASAASPNQSTVPAAGLTQEASAGGQLQEVIVTAEKRGAESVLSVPQSISVVTAESLSRNAATGLDDFADEIPGLAVFGFGSDRNGIKIRGISSSTTGEPEETVGVYLDDLPITNPGGTNNEFGSSPDLDLFDLARVEVLKGPQGTLYGAGSMGGTIRYITNPPDLERFEGDVRSMVSTTAHGEPSYSGDLMLNAPLVNDALAARLVVSDAHDGGYINNAASFTGYGLGTAGKPEGAAGFNFDNHWTARAELLYKPADSLRIKLWYLNQTYDANDVDGIPVGTGSVGALDQLRSLDYTIPFSQDHLDLYDAVIEYDTPLGLITSSTGYRRRRVLDSFDETTFFRSIVFGPGAPPDALLDLNRYHDFTQELRIASHGGSPFKYVGGVFYSDLEKTYIQDSPYPDINTYLAGAGASPLPQIPALLVLSGQYPDIYQAVIEQNLKQFATYAELSYSFTRWLELTLGGRYFDVRQNYDEKVNPQSVFASPGAFTRLGYSRETGGTPKVTVSAKPNSHTLLYATVAKGFRPGGFNQPVPAIPTCASQLTSLGIDNSAPTFNADTVWSYEVGGKSQLLGNRLQVTGALYHIDWRQIQLEQFLTCGFSFFTNGGAAKINGGEAGLSAAPTRNWRINMSVGYTHAYLAVNAATLGVEGDPLPGIPRFTGSLTTDYQIPLGWAAAFIGGQVTYVSSFNSQINPANPQNDVAGSYGIVNLHGGLTLSSGLTVEAFVKNAADRLAVTGSLYTPFGNSEYVTPPRQIGVSIEKVFE